MNQRPDSVIIKHNKLQIRIRKSSLYLDKAPRHINSATSIHPSLPPSPPHFHSLNQFKESAGKSNCNHNKSYNNAPIRIPMPYIKIDAPIWIGFLPSFLPLFLFLSFSFFLSLLAIYDFHSVLFAAFFFRAEFKSRTESTGGKSNWSKTKWMYECRHDGRRQVRQLTSGLFISFGPIQLGLSSSTNSPPHKDNSPPIQNNMIPKKKIQRPLESQTNREWDHQNH